MIEDILEQLNNNKYVTLYESNKIKLSDSSYLCTINFKEAGNTYNPNQLKLEFPDYNPKRTLYSFDMSK